MDAPVNPSRKLPGRFPSADNVEYRDSVRETTKGSHNVVTGNLKQLALPLHNASTEGSLYVPDGWTLGSDRAAAVQPNTSLGASLLRLASIDRKTVSHPSTLPNSSHLTRYPFELGQAPPPSAPPQVDRPDSPTDPLRTIRSPLMSHPRPARNTHFAFTDAETCAGSLYFATNDMPLAPSSPGRCSTKREVCSTKRWFLEKSIQIEAQKNKELTEIANESSRHRHMDAAIAAKAELNERQSTQQRETARLSAEEQSRNDQIAAATEAKEKVIRNANERTMRDTREKDMLETDRNERMFQTEIIAQRTELGRREQQFQEERNKFHHDERERQRKQEKNATAGAKARAMCEAQEKAVREQQEKLKKQQETAALKEKAVHEANRRTSHEANEKVIQRAYENAMRETTKKQQEREIDKLEVMPGAWQRWDQEQKLKRQQEADRLLAKMRAKVKYVRDLQATHEKLNLESMHQKIEEWKKLHEANKLKKQQEVDELRKQQQVDRLKKQQQEARLAHATLIVEKSRERVDASGLKKQQSGSESKNQLQDTLRVDELAEQLRDVNLNSDNESGDDNDDGDNDWEKVMDPMAEWEIVKRDAPSGHM